MKFKARGHPLITATHKNTFELTREESMTENGDCIIGVAADFDFHELKEFIRGVGSARIIMEVEGHREVSEFLVNDHFDDDEEIVVRRTDFISGRTLGTRADRVCKDFSRDFVKSLQSRDSTLNITIERLNKI